MVCMDAPSHFPRPGSVSTFAVALDAKSAGVMLFFAIFPILPFLYRDQMPMRMACSLIPLTALLKLPYEKASISYKTMPYNPTPTLEVSALAYRA